VPEIIQKALESSPAGRRSTSSKRDSMQRKRSWWLPYVVLEFDKNEILIDALGGDLSKPEWNYRADLCVLCCCHGASNHFDTFLSDVSRTSSISVSAYLRTAQCLQGQDDMGNDILMARVELTPVLDGQVGVPHVFKRSCGLIPIAV
jgi:serum/glucocorticoid-regulated kinase 2